MKTLESKRYIIKEKIGYTPMVGRLLSMMEYTRLTTLEAVDDLTQEQLDYRIDGRGIQSVPCYIIWHVWKKFI